VVWLALTDLADARGSAVVTPTRGQLAALTGIRRHKSISQVLTTLEKAGWIDRMHVPVIVGGKRAATLLRIILRRRGRKTPQDFPYGKGAVPAARPFPPVGDGAAAPAQIAPEHPSARRERERLAEIRARREREA